ncbi:MULTISPECIES: non-hydrolyzing UDP-N-acetylglucosamine 2-epimerase [Dactylosporangium]|uniref:UDP-N-acetylglucosamine 2-epimerase (non-hydrolyzing) n=2 Tax=Dactylosporangium TaxID=35753 RepID=A0A9W6NPF8_9ACTN|nr:MULTISPECIES: UDP-N-acetylglucosamine 2-epimerase (non-hydrolyzing) [Dactylosporangium]UAB98632.1 UDP-N-acetylglucosamine 2-epimerase (non-hydrolyzing) [Dactylosporangium vinaceum]UWZ46886.1 UDP-N-acetylglucosamine 2-epimerase (non-hydrolyzing) [Dactylosporangium matsuzakiense]GLL04226.1 UDP-N-acetyl glucosamine 2-epimerase [Dactylosporangium matsuzakiense]
MLPEVFLIAGTRPEAIKLAPVAAAMRAAGRLAPVMVASGQHPAMVTQALEAFDTEADVTLPLQRVTGSQPELLTEMIKQLDALLEVRKPAAVIVQGDTTTTLAGAMAAFWRRIPVVHLEAGLRSGDLDSPFPEEANRKLVGQLAALHLAPTALAATNLLDESIAPANVLITGNTVVDAALEIAAKELPFDDARVAAAVDAAENGEARLVLVTAHRRESWGEPLDRILRAVRRLVEAYPDIRVVLPAHANPAVRAQVEAGLAGVPRVTITDPLPYPALARVLSQAYLALTDSGGIQEEAPSFQVPALVLRELTERVESLQAGCAKLVGTDEDLIVSEAARLLDDPMLRQSMTANGNPYGDGLASQRTEQAVAAMLGLASVPSPMPSSASLV